MEHQSIKLKIAIAHEKLTRERGSLKANGFVGWGGGYKEGSVPLPTSNVEVEDHSSKSEITI